MWAASTGSAGWCSLRRSPGLWADMSRVRRKQRRSDCSEHSMSMSSSASRRATTWAVGCLANFGAETAASRAGKMRPASAQALCSLPAARSLLSAATRRGKVRGGGRASLSWREAVKDELAPASQQRVTLGQLWRFFSRSAVADGHTKKKEVATGVVLPSLLPQH
eukprot:610139-Pleurochrysis_carterae.AAC.1